MEKLFISKRAEWRKWLSTNHDRNAEIWLVYYKKASGKTSIEYEASVEEALCFGWVDSMIKRLDDEKYARKFTPRKDASNWSESNKRRALKMITLGLMTTHGQQKIEAAKQLGTWDTPEQKPDIKFQLLPEFEEALAGNEKAHVAFHKLSATHKKQYLGWIEIAKRPETRQKRIAESIRLLAKGQKLGLR